MDNGLCDAIELDQSLVRALIALGSKYSSNLQLDQLLQAMPRQFWYELTGAAAIRTSARAEAPEFALGMVCLGEVDLNPLRACPHLSRAGAGSGTQLIPGYAFREFPLLQWTRTCQLRI